MPLAFITQFYAGSAGDSSVHSHVMTVLELAVSDGSFTSAIQTAASRRRLAPQGLRARRLSMSSATADSVEVATFSPTPVPSPVPTAPPSPAPSSLPSSLPMPSPTRAPTHMPSRAPTRAPSSSPSGPTNAPIRVPSHEPSLAPSRAPSRAPSHMPSGTPSISSTALPSSVTLAPTITATTPNAPTSSAQPVPTAHSPDTTRSREQTWVFVGIAFAALAAFIVAVVCWRKTKNSSREEVKSTPKGGLGDKESEAAKVDTPGCELLMATPMQTVLESAPKVAGIDQSADLAFVLSAAVDGSFVFCAADMETA